MHEKLRFVEGWLTGLGHTKEFVAYELTMIANGKSTGGMSDDAVMILTSSEYLDKFGPYRAE